MYIWFAQELVGMLFGTVWLLAIYDWIYLPEELRETVARMLLFVALINIIFLGLWVLVNPDTFKSYNEQTGADETFEVVLMTLIISCFAYFIVGLLMLLIVIFFTAIDWVNIFFRKLNAYSEAHSGEVIVVISLIGFITLGIIAFNSLNKLLNIQISIGKNNEVGK
jgi:hypothetical protein